MSGEVERRPTSQGSGLTTQQEYWLGLYQQYHEDLRRYFAKYVKCSHDVDDLMQTVFLHLIAHRGDLLNPHAYVYAMARHQLLSYWRGRKRSILTERFSSSGPENYESEVASCDSAGDPLEEVSHHEIHTELTALMASLSPVLGEALRLRYWDGLRLDAAAARAGCSCLALKKRLERAKQSLLQGWQVRGGLVGG